MGWRGVCEGGRERGTGGSVSSIAALRERIDCHNHQLGNHPHGTAGRGPKPAIQPNHIMFEPTTPPGATWGTQHIIIEPQSPTPTTRQDRMLPKMYGDALRRMADGGTSRGSPIDADAFVATARVFGLDR